jgi:hypothetical protein
MRETYFLPRFKILIGTLISILSISFLYTQETLQINYGDNVSGSISVQGKMDAYTFTGEAGDYVIIQMRINSSTNEPSLELYNSSGSLISSKSLTNAIDKLDASKRELYVFTSRSYLM